MSAARRLFLLNTARLAAATSSLAAHASHAAPVTGRAYPFSLGVASGSPLPHAVVLWTRILADPLNGAATAPAGATLPAKLKLAVASCQHWEFGHYAAHRHIAAAAPDLVAFLGDYIYEWGPYQLRHPERALRRDESFTLAQYRVRYAQ